MALLECEQHGDTLWLWGNIVPAADRELQTQMLGYLKMVKAPNQVLDMSGVRYLGSSGAKLIVEAAQASFEGALQPAKVKVLASPPTERTLKQIGGERWLVIESCPKPNVKPPSPTVAAAKFITPLPGSFRGPVGDPLRPEKTPGLESAIGLNRPGGSAVSATPAVQAQERVISASPLKPGTVLAEEGEELTGVLCVLSKIVVMGSYTFHVMGSNAVVTGKVIGRAGGPWIMLDIHGAKRLVNLENVGVIEVLA